MLIRSLLFVVCGVFFFSGLCLGDGYSEEHFFTYSEMEPMKADFIKHIKDRSRGVDPGSRKYYRDLCFLLVKDHDGEPVRAFKIDVSGNYQRIVYVPGLGVVTIASRASPKAILPNTMKKLPMDIDDDPEGPIESVSIEAYREAKVEFQVLESFQESFQESFLKGADLMKDILGEPYLVDKLVHDLHIFVTSPDIKPLYVRDYVYAHSVVNQRLLDSIGRMDPKEVSLELLKERRDFLTASGEYDPIRFLYRERIRGSTNSRVKEERAFQVAARFLANVDTVHRHLSSGHRGYHELKAMASANMLKRIRDKMGEVLEPIHQVHKDMQAQPGYQEELKQLNEAIAAQKEQESP